ncbi:hypothetical protein EVAR_6167_1 [Eumeta japonica]|uniref:Uncharacterized protein n=1 Tax=Eumeta variegata TaxID=151549 RepID=A0A4C1TF73_EUMVA|nr:hypothetical protein EVAR_6167_1 [Eumeta japonica]
MDLIRGHASDGAPLLPRLAGVKILGRNIQVVIHPTLPTVVLMKQSTYGNQRVVTTRQFENLTTCEVHNARANIFHHAQYIRTTVETSRFSLRQGRLQWPLGTHLPPARGVVNQFRDRPRQIFSNEEYADIIYMDILMVTLRLLAVKTFVVFLIVGYHVLVSLVRCIGEFEKLALCNDD